MKRMILKSIVFIFALSLLTTGAMAADEPLIMKLPGTVPANPELGDYKAMLKFAELVGKYSNSEIKVEVYPGNQLGTTIEYLEGTSLGTIESAITGTDILTTLAPSMNLFVMPYLFKDFEHQLALLEKPNPIRDQIYKECIERANLRPVARLYRGFRVLCNSKRDVRSPADMKGLKIRSPEAAVNTQVIKAMGGIPVTLTLSEVFTSVAQGVCDGTENPITELFGINMQEVVSHVSETNHIPAIILLVVNEDWYQSLTPSQREAIDRAGQETTDYRIAILKAEQEASYKAFTDRGVKVLRAADIDMAAFVEAVQPLYKLFLDRFDEKLYFAIRDMKY